MTNLIRLPLYLVILILLAAFKKDFIEFAQRLYMGNRNQDIPSGPTDKALHKSFFMSFGRIAEKRFKSVVSRKSGITFLLLSMGAKAVFYSHFSVVKDHFGRNTAENFKGANKSIQETLLVLTVISENDRLATIT